MEEEILNMKCETCGGGRFVDGRDGFYYCTDCHQQNLSLGCSTDCHQQIQDVMETGMISSSTRSYVVFRPCPGEPISVPKIKPMQISLFMPEKKEKVSVDEFLRKEKVSLEEFMHKEEVVAEKST